MILIDTSVWADHFRTPDPMVVRLLGARRVVGHRLVVEELALGRLPERDKTILGLDRLPVLEMLGHDAILRFVAGNGLVAAGLGLVDIHLLASSVSAGTRLWARDKRLAAQALRLDCAWLPPKDD